MTKEEIKEYQKRYYQEHKEAITKRQKEYRSNHKILTIPKTHGRIADIDLILDKMNQFKSDIPTMSDIELLLFNALYSMVDSAEVLIPANNKEEE